MERQKKEKLSALRAVFDSVISGIITKCKDLIKDTKKGCDDEIFQSTLDDDSDETKVFNTFAPLKEELNIVDALKELDVDFDSKEEERQKLMEKALQLQKVVKEQSEKLRQKENQELPTKRKTAKHLEKIVSSGDKIIPAITINNVYQQRLQAKEIEMQNVDVNMHEKKTEKENVDWIKSKSSVNPHSTNTSLMEVLAKKMRRLNESNALTTNHIVKFIQYDMHYVH